MNHCHIGDCRAVMKDLVHQGVKVQMCVTSPPYWGLRDYGVPGQLGLEKSPQEYVANMVDVFRLVRELLADDGTLWLNLGDSYAANRSYQVVDNKHTNVGNHMASEVPDGLKQKDLVGIPWRVAFALQADGWYLRQDIIWSKPNPMPESVRDRCTKAHEYIFLLSKSERYYYDADAIAEPAIHAGKVVYNDAGKNADMGAFGATRTGFLKPDGVTVNDERNKRSVWTVATQPFSSRSLGLRGASDGSGRKASPSCPVHGVHGYLASKATRDAQRVASPSARSQRNDSHPELWPLAEPSPIEKHHAEDSFRGSLDSPVQPCVQTAIDHSNETHKTGLVLSTLPRETFGVESLDHTADNELSRATIASADRIPLSNIGADYGVGVRVTDRAAQIPDDNACTCAYEDIIDHFAVFPPALIEPCILAGSRPGDTVLDPFFGSGTVGEVCNRLGRQWLGCELNPDYAALQDKRTAQQGMVLV